MQYMVLRDVDGGEGDNEKEREGRDGKVVRWC